MNGAAPELDARVAAQQERLAKKAQEPAAPPPETAATAPANDEEAQVVAVLSATLLSNGTARIDMPENRQHFLALVSVLIGQGLERAAAAGQQVGAEEAARAIAANPKLGPLLWFKQKFGRNVTGRQG